MRPLARAAALAVVTSLALPACVVAIDTEATHEEDPENAEELRDADEAHRDARLLQLEERMDRLEQNLPK